METDKQKFHNQPNVDPITGDIILINSKRYKELTKKYGPVKIKSPVTNKKITVGKDKYKKLLKQGYTDEQLLNIQANDLQLNNDIMYEIMLNAPIDTMNHLCLSNQSLYHVCQSDDFWNVKLSYHLLPQLSKSLTINQWIKAYTKLSLYQHNVIKFINRMLELNVSYIICDGVVKNMTWYDFDITNKDGLKITFFIQDDYIGFLSTYQDVESSDVKIPVSHLKLINDFTLLLYYSPDVKFGRGLTCYDAKDKKILQVPYIYIRELK
jgi:hypothetical protein